MVKVSSRALQQSIEVNRMIGQIKGAESGPVNIFLAGIHGNEPAGIFALKQVFQLLKEQKTAVNGSIYAISGNLSALEKGIRYHKKDLNRLWTAHRIKEINEGKSDAECSDEKEQREIYGIIRNILAENDGPFYFTDLHTTSSKTIPFITINDTLLNRKFTQNYPVPLVLGIEEYLNGPVLSYINELGYVAFGFEGGQHDDIKAIDNHVAFVFITLVLTGCIAKTTENKEYLDHLSRETVGITGFYEIFHRHKIEDRDHFKMQPGYVNFQCVRKGRYLAASNNTPLLALKKSRVLMPLYQDQGEDGYFLIQRIAPFFLQLSALLRKINIDGLLSLLPGIHWQNEQKESLRVNLKIARLFTKSFFHLLGYRSININHSYMLVSSREAASLENDYLNTEWYGNVLSGSKKTKGSEK